MDKDTYIENLIERTSTILGTNTRDMTLMDIIEKLVEVVENGIPDGPRH